MMRPGEMTAPGEHLMRQPRRAWNAVDETPLQPTGHWVVPSKQTKERLVELLEECPSGFLGFV